MLTLALVGPDGAGKTTVARRLEQELDPSVKYLYMGVSVGLVESRPTDHAPRRGVEAPPGRRGGHPRAACQGGGIRAACPCRCAQACAAVGEGDAAARRTVSAEEWYRQYLAWSYGRQGSRRRLRPALLRRLPRLRRRRGTGAPGEPAHPRLPAREGVSEARSRRLSGRARQTCSWRGRARGRPSSSSSAATTTSLCAR